VDGDFVFKGDNSQDSAFKLLDSQPESPTIAFLRFDADRVLQNLNAPFFLKIGPFTQHFILKIQGVFVLCHMKIYACNYKKS
jgi:hypothetical protein